MNIVNFSLVRLFDASRVSLIEHITKLSADDRYLRFGTVVSDDVIEKYVTDSLLVVNNRADSEFWFAIISSDVILATIHISIHNVVAEFAFTTDVDYRDRKLGQLLFARGYQLATEFCISSIYMVCLGRNSAMRHIAKKFGLTVITHGSELEASVDISYPVPISDVTEMRMLFIDKNVS
jgi:hypothetical protein